MDSHGCIVLHVVGVVCFHIHPNIIFKNYKYAY
jgi:hypothetical protein